MKVKENAAEPSGFEYDFYTYQKSVPSEPNSERSLDSDGKPVEKLLDKTNLPADLVKVSKYTEDADGKSASGFYDKRQRTGMDVIDIDVGLLRQTVDSTDPAFDDTAWNDTFNLESGGAYDWNGIVYVEIPTVAGASGRIDKVKKGKSGIAVRLKTGLKSPPLQDLLTKGLR